MTIPTHSRRQILASAVVASAGAALMPIMQGCTEDHGAETLERVRPSIRPDAQPSMPVTLNVNGVSHPLDLDPRVSLLDALRDHIGLTGTKKGCDHGQCGACTVLIDNRRVNSCLTLAVAAQTRKITTIEGIASGNELHPVQAAFIEHDGFQCGYCTPGQICSAVGLIHEGHAKNDADIREQMSGNICRCGAYPNILAAVKQAMHQHA